METAAKENLSRDQYLYLAKLAEQAERYEEMAEFMRSVVLSAAPASELTAEERGLLSVAFKHVVGSLRAAWRIVNSIEHRDDTRRRNAEDAALARAYRGRVESMLSDAVASVLRLVDSHLLPSAHTAVSRVFFLKMKGDYHRYLAEFQSGDLRRSSAQITMASYEAAQELALELPSKHPVKLGLALNFSVFYYEILEQHEKAYDLAKQAFEDAISESDSEGGEAYKDSTLIMQLLRDNLSLWTSDAQETKAI